MTKVLALVAGTITEVDVTAAPSAFLLDGGDATTGTAGIALIDCGGSS